MGSVNKVILVGHLGRDPEIRSPANMPDAENATLSIATSETWKDRHSGERKEKTEWHRVVIFNPHLVEVAKNFLKKGSPVYIEGALQTRKWTDQQGTERYSTEVVVGRFKGALTLLGSAGGGTRGPTDEHDGYGTQRPRDAAGRGSGTGSGYGAVLPNGRNADGGGAGSGWEPPPDLDDEIPFAWPGDMPIGRPVPGL